MDGSRRAFGRARWLRDWLFCGIALLVLVLAALTHRSGRGGSTSQTDDPYTLARQRMVREQIERRGVHDPRVLRAMGSVPRHVFVPETLRDSAYDDAPLAIGEGQTISQPYIVAFMTESIRPQASDRVLEVGTGSGYQAAVLAAVVGEVFSIEIRPALAEAARRRLADLGCRNVALRTGDGYAGWPEAAPYDAIIVTAAPREVPGPLVEQLKVGGRMVVPIGSGDQQLVRLTRTTRGIDRETLLPVRFVPMTGEAQRTD